MDFNKVPKILSETVSVGSVKYSFFIGFSSGMNQAAFAIAPDAAKGLVDILQKAITQYESQFGVIDTSGNKVGIHSPIQPGQ